jgi:hypothetical protein
MHQAVVRGQAARPIAYLGSTKKRFRKGHRWDGRFTAVDYSELPLTLQAVKELKAENDSLQATCRRARTDLKDARDGRAAVTTRL